MGTPNSAWINKLNPTKSMLVGLQCVVKKAVGLGGRHWLIIYLPIIIRHIPLKLQVTPSSRIAYWLAYRNPSSYFGYEFDESAWCSVLIHLDIPPHVDCLYCLYRFRSCMYVSVRCFEIAQITSNYEDWHGYFGMRFSGTSLALYLTRTKIFQQFNRGAGFSSTVTSQAAGLRITNWCSSILCELEIPWCWVCQYNPTLQGTRTSTSHVSQ